MSVRINRAAAAANGNGARTAGKDVANLMEQRTDGCRVVQGSDQLERAAVAQRKSIRRVAELMIVDHTQGAARTVHADRASKGLHAAWVHDTGLINRQRVCARERICKRQRAAATAEAVARRARSDRAGVRAESHCAKAEACVAAEIKVCRAVHAKRERAGRCTVDCREQFVGRSIACDDGGSVWSRHIHRSAACERVGVEFESASRTDCRCAEALRSVKAEVARAVDDVRREGCSDVVVKRQCAGTILGDICRRSRSRIEDEFAICRSGEDRSGRACCEVERADGARSACNAQPGIDVHIDGLTGEVTSIDQQLTGSADVRFIACAACTQSAGVQKERACSDRSDSGVGVYRTAESERSGACFVQPARTREAHIDRASCECRSAEVRYRERSTADDAAAIAGQRSDGVIVRADVEDTLRHGDGGSIRDLVRLREADVCDVAVCVCCVER